MLLKTQDVYNDKANNMYYGMSTTLWLITDEAIKCNTAPPRKVSEHNKTRDAAKKNENDIAIWEKSGKRLQNSGGKVRIKSCFKVKRHLS